MVTILGNFGTFLQLPSSGTINGSFFTYQQVTRRHDIVADGWAGAANPHPHPTPYPTPLPTQTHTQKASKTLVFPLFDSCSRMDGWTNKAFYRVAWPQLKSRFIISLD